MEETSPNYLAFQKRMMPNKAKLLIEASMWGKWSVVLKKWILIFETNYKVVQLLAVPAYQSWSAGTILYVSKVIKKLTDTLTDELLLLVFEEGCFVNQEESHPLLFLAESVHEVYHARLIPGTLSSADVFQIDFFLNETMIARIETFLFSWNWICLSGRFIQICIYWQVSPTRFPVWGTKR